MGFRDDLPKYDLAGKTAIVTGAAQGIGYEVAGMLAAAGAQVVIADLNDEQSKKSAQEILST